MTARVLIECGAAETRAVRVVGEEILGFWFGPARGDEALARPADAGDVYAVRLRAVAPALGGAFVDLGEARDGFLSLKTDEGRPAEGETALARVRRPAIGRKGALLSLDWRKGLAGEEERAIEEAARSAAPPARLGPRRDAALAAARALGANAADRIVVDRPEAAQVLRAAGIDAAPGETLFEDAGAAEALDAAFASEVPLAGGGRMIFFETEAGVLVDIDAAAAAEAGAGPANDRVNEAAARRLFGELSRRAAGGRILVDFLPPSGAAARAALLGALKASRGRYGARFGALRADGLFDMTAPRGGPSLLERASEPAAKGLIRSGRRLTLDWRARAAIRELEGRLARRPAARFVLFAQEDIASYLKARPQWTGRLVARFGARCEYAQSEQLREGEFELVEKA